MPYQALRRVTPCQSYALLHRISLVGRGRCVKRVCSQRQGEKVWVAIQQVHVLEPLDDERCMLF